MQRTNKSNNNAINLTTGSIQNEVSIALQSTDAVPAAGTVLNPTKDLLRSLLLFSLSLFSLYVTKQATIPCGRPGYEPMTSSRWKPEP